MDNKFEIKPNAPEVPKNFPIPLWEGVIVKKAALKIEDTLFIPDTAKSPTNEGWVMAVGEGVKSKIEVGMRVVYNKLANLYFVHNDEVYLGLHENDVFAKVEQVDGVDTPIPFNKMVFLRKSPEEIKLPSGIILPESQKEVLYGYIISVGEKARPDLKPGMKIVHAYYQDSEFMFRNQRVFFMPDISILIIMPDKDTHTGVFDHGRERRPDIPFDQLPEKEPAKVVKGTFFHETPKKDE